MADPSCPLIVGDAAVEMTNAAYERFLAFANMTYAQASGALNELSRYVVRPVTFNASFDPQIALSDFVMPDAPAPVTTTYVAPPAPPAPPLIPIPGDYQPSPAPIDDSIAPTINDIASPVFDPIKAPGDAPAIRDFTFPDAPTLVFPDEPTFYQITLPDVPTVTIPTFSGDRPTFDVPIPDGNFSFTPTEYQSDFLDELKFKLAGMVNDPTGLPVAVAQALRDRAMNEADVQERRAVQAAYDEFASRGFSEPNGMLTRRVVEARQSGMDARSTINRDIFIQEQTVLIDNLKFAISNGIALESKLLDAHVSYMQMSLEAAKYALDASISIFNARVSAFNAQIIAYQADASVFRDLIQAELAKVQVYTAQLDGQRLIVELNGQQVQIYEAQLRAVSTMVDIYNAQIRAVATEIDANKAQIEAFEATVRAYAAQYQAQTAQVDVYRARVDAERTKVSLYETSTNAFGNRVRAWSEKENLTIQSKRLTLDYSKAHLDQWQAQVSEFETALKAELARVSTAVQLYQADADLYKSKASVLSSAAEANNRAFQLNLAQEQAIVDTELKRADFDLEQLKYISSTDLDRLKSIAQISSQLTSAAMSAVNFHAGVSSSLGQSYGCNTSISYSGSLDTETI